MQTQHNEQETRPVPETKLDHIPGGSLLDPVLEELAKEPGGFLTTTELMQRLRDRFALPGPDGALLQLGAEGAFDEAVMKLVTAAWQQAGASGEGMARLESDRHGWHITAVGKDFITGVV